MIEKIFHFTTAGLVLMLGFIALPVFMPELITKLGWDLCTVCHQALTRVYPLLFIVGALQALGICATLALRDSKPDGSRHS